MARRQCLGNLGKHLSEELVTLLQLTQQALQSDKCQMSHDRGFSSAGKEAEAPLRQVDWEEVAVQVKQSCSCRNAGLGSRSRL